MHDGCPDATGDGATTIVSLGSSCNVAYHLDRLGLRKAAYPLDWARTSLRCVTEALEDDLRLWASSLCIKHNTTTTTTTTTTTHTWLPGDDQVPLPPSNPGTTAGPPLTNAYGAHFPHDATAGTPWPLQASEVQQRYERRIARLRHALGRPAHHMVCFVRWSPRLPGPKPLARFLAALTRFCATASASWRLVLVVPQQQRPLLAGHHACIAEHVTRLRLLRVPVVAVPEPDWRVLGVEWANVLRHHCCQASTGVRLRASVNPKPNDGAQPDPASLVTCHPRLRWWARSVVWPALGREPRLAYVTLHLEPQVRLVTAQGTHVHDDDPMQALQQQQQQQQQHSPPQLLRQDGSYALAHDLVECPGWHVAVTLCVRRSFSDDDDDMNPASWDRVCAAVRRVAGERAAYVRWVVAWRLQSWPASRCSVARCDPDTAARVGVGLDAWQSHLGSFVQGVYADRLVHALVMQALVALRQRLGRALRVAGLGGEAAHVALLHGRLWPRWRRWLVHRLRYCSTSPHLVADVVHNAAHDVEQLACPSSYADFALATFVAHSDVLLVNVSRKGLGAAMAPQVQRLAHSPRAHHVLYVACNPRAAQRDLTNWHVRQRHVLHSVYLYEALNDAAMAVAHDGEHGTCEGE